MNFLFTAVLLVIAGYVLYSAITAKGKLFSVENIKEELIPKFKKILRPLYVALGILMLFMGIVSAYQNVVFSEYTYRFADDFSVYYADSIDADGNIKGTSANIHNTYGYTEMSSIFSALETPEVPDNVSPTYAEPVRDENGDYVFLGIGETSVHQNETYASLRSVISYKASQIITWVLMGVSIVLVAGVFIIIHRFTDKEKLAKAKAQAGAGGSSMPSAAFDFSDEASDEAEAK